MSIETEYRLALGTIAPALFDSSYDVGLWDRPADMPDMLDWIVQGDSDKFERYEEHVIAFDYSQGGFGAASFQWAIAMTPGMLAQFRQDFFGATAGDPMSGNLSADVTARTYDATWGDEWLIVNATLLFPRAQDMTRFGTIWLVPLRFVNVQVAAGGFSDGFSYGFS